MGHNSMELRKEKVNAKYKRIVQAAIDKHPDQTTEERIAMLNEIKARYAKELERKRIVLCTSPK